MKQEKVHTDFYKHSLSNSRFRRLSWSSDGQLISTTGGKIGAAHISPIIDRSQWNHQVSMAGHKRPVVVTRFNPKLFKNQSSLDFDPSTGAYTEIPGCYSVLAVASIESTISIWKPQMTQPLAVFMDVFKMGITDMTWGFNGNFLLVSSNDGSIAYIQFQPGLLGKLLTEKEKEVIIQKKYGASVLSEYKKHNKLIDHDPQMQSENGALNVVSLQKAERMTNGKMKIIPTIDKKYDTR